MEDVVKIAVYICDRYQKTFGKRIDEMKLHKLPYFTQRKCIAQTDKSMSEFSFLSFDGCFLAKIKFIATC